MSGCRLERICKSSLPNCPTEEEPPNMKMGCPAYLPRPPVAQGGYKSAPPRSPGFAYRPRAAVSKVKGIAAAWSKVRLEGIYISMTR